jgi:hypothetical protein
MNEQRLKEIREHVERNPGFGSSAKLVTELLSHIESLQAQLERVKALKPTRVSTYENCIDGHNEKVIDYAEFLQALKDE